MACVDLHHMILEDECDDYVKVVEPNFDVQFCWRLSFVMFCQKTKIIENSNLHFKLCIELIEYLWQLKNN
jgi:hypothetical protein